MSRVIYSTYAWSDAMTSGSPHNITSYNTGIFYVILYIYKNHVCIRLAACLNLLCLILSTCGYYLGRATAKAISKKYKQSP